MSGLQNGFWPLDTGEWKVHLAEVIDNYLVDPADLEAIQKFCDKEVAANHWSDPIPELLPRMKISLMFVIWQHGKPHVITDHAGSGLNDGISRNNTKVSYDDMHLFGQTMQNECRSHPRQKLLTFKSDVSSAFLNPPAHPIWQLRQVVTVNTQLFIICQLVFGN